MEKKEQGYLNEFKPSTDINEIKEQLSEHNLDEPTVLGLADDIYLLDEVRGLGLN